MRNVGHEVAFISFDDRSTEMLCASGFKVFSLSDSSVGFDTSDGGLDRELKKYGIENLNFWFGHERFAFGIRDSIELRRKLLGALAVADKACVEWQRNGEVTMVQELGGFLSVIGSYFAARKHGIDNWFVEPSFFRGRLLFLRNSFSALSVNSAVDELPSKEVEDYLLSAIANSTIVVPQKDKHQYAAPWKKIVNIKNLRRLFEKLLDKYWFGKRQEFGYIGRHISLHAKMLWSELRLRSHYTSIDECKRFVYYPLHVPGDMALTLRSPSYLDQLALIDYIARSVPYTHKVAIKEHPAMIGAVDSGRLLELMAKHDNLILLPPSTNNYKVLSAADAVVSVNSKSGAEATLLGKPVLVLGDAFYSGSPLVHRIDGIQDLPSCLRSVLQQPTILDHDLVSRYFEAVWRSSFPGELYVNDEDNVRVFMQSMMSATSTL